MPDLVNTQLTIKGTEATRRFYDKKGWLEQDGRLEDQRLFGVREDGPIRQAVHQLRIERIKRALLPEGAEGVNLLEAGCGGNPEISLLDICGRYTGVDFSRAGIEEADKYLHDLAVGVPFHFEVADITDLPFEDGTFDAVYSAHVLYHIEDPESQKKAFEEMMRVLKPGGVSVLILTNPRPLAFPLRIIKSLIADTPGMSAVVKRFRNFSDLPYRPMSLGWMRREFSQYAEISIDGYALASTEFNHRITEKQGVGRLAWRAIAWAERNHPKLAARLGNYVQVTARKR